MNLSSSATTVENVLTKAGVWLQPLLLLAMRLYWGWQFTVTGWSKIAHLTRTAGYFESLGIPLPMVSATAAGLVECVGGLLLLLGLFSRMASAALMVVMVVAYLTAERMALAGLLGIWGGPEDFVRAGPFLYLLTALIVLAFGPGKLSLDTVIRKKG